MPEGWVPFKVPRFLQSRISESDIRLVRDFAYCGDLVIMIFLLSQTMPGLLPGFFCVSEQAFSYVEMQLLLLVLLGFC